ncbi:TetR/AcrR family transcriptional regulator [uncultured Maricaulis sp.]|uniref:TetR/AcrR family transcriptional regulator n=1 Tax=uncultured Maricaulis sp. TaxID=174710 RepID=UPI0026130342|nr:TetR/AcrR family transcriptional regulator [uncultured Maricaulis sp.]
MTGLRDRKKQALRQAIYDAGLQLFERDGYDAVSVAMITRELKIAKGTFFNHFPNKADILAEWYETTMMASLAAALPGGLSPIERLVERIHSGGAEAAKAPELWRAKNAEATRTASIQDAEYRVDTAFRACLLDEIQSAMQDRVWRSDVAPDALADLVAALATGTWREVMIANRVADARSLLNARLATLQQLCRIVSEPPKR